MLIGVLQFELIVPESRSLKDKRRVVKSVKDRLHREHLVSVAEVEALDHHRIAVMGLALVSNSSVYIHSVFDRILHKLSTLEGARLGEATREVLHGDQLPTAFQTDEGEPLWTDDERRDAPEARP
ncbi:MAG: DUF503 domain-containing protein [Phycisphaerales bacterium]|nr:DUF503 domain-containing protein [Phycisphaerales bacterium]